MSEPPDRSLSADAARRGAARLHELKPHERRRLLAGALARIVVITTALFVLYAVLPIPGESGTGALAGLVAGLLAMAALLAWQVRHIIAASHPQLRAVEAAVVALVVLIVVFAFTYLSLSHNSAASFSGRMDRVGAIYFTVTVLGTVGFGDIVARSHAARILVTIQIVLDLGVLVAIVRVVGFAARIGITRQRDGAPGNVGAGT